jgi:catechol 2,3-dioxygenase-like lactoylglutathione lyase family enzyme
MAAKINNDGIEIGIIVRDAEKSLAFYRDILGLEYVGDLTFPGNHMWRFQAGKSIVKLLAQDPPPQESNPAGDASASGLRYFSLFVANIDEVVADVEAAGATVAIAVTEFQPGARFAMVEDPEGNRIELLDLAALAG